MQLQQLGEFANPRRRFTPTQVIRCVCSLTLGAALLGTEHLKFARKDEFVARKLSQRCSGRKWTHTEHFETCSGPDHSGPDQFLRDCIARRIDSVKKVLHLLIAGHANPVDASKDRKARMRGAMCLAIRRNLDPRLQITHRTLYDNKTMSCGDTSRSQVSFQSRAIEVPFFLFLLGEFDDCDDSCIACFPCDHSWLVVDNLLRW